MKKSPKSAKFFASHWSAFLQQFKNLHLRGDRFVMLTVAGLINAFGVSIFLYPVNLYDSGISGTAMLSASSGFHRSAQLLISTSQNALS